MAADITAINAAPLATIIDLAPSLGRHTVWELHHYERGQGAGRSLAPDAELPGWLRDLTEAGRVIGLGWELRSEDAPDGWRHEFACPNCGDWSVVPDEDGADGAAWCEECGAHMDGERLDTRPLTVDQIIAHHRDGGTR